MRKARVHSRCKICTGYLSCRKASGRLVRTCHHPHRSVASLSNWRKRNRFGHASYERSGENKLLESKFTVVAMLALLPAGWTLNVSSNRRSTARRDPVMVSCTRSLCGCLLRRSHFTSDVDDNAKLYGKRLDSREIVTTRTKLPKAAIRFVDELNRDSDHERTTASGSSQ